MNDFASDIRQWRAHTDFAAHLAKHDPIVCNWVHAVVIHHTVKPTPDTWRGLESMQSLRRYYQQNKKWPSGPHLFICAGARNPAHDGIFQLTPLNIPGTHATICNQSTIGVEVVGYYDNRGWSEATTDLVRYTLAHFMNWRSIARNGLVGHRDCHSPKTCPGREISIDRVRDMVWTTRNKIYA